MIVLDTMPKFRLTILVNNKQGNLRPSQQYP